MTMYWNGVVLKRLFINGVEQANHSWNGVEVFSSGLNLSDILFDIRADLYEYHNPNLTSGYMSRTGILRVSEMPIGDFSIHRGLAI